MNARDSQVDDDRRYSRMATQVERMGRWNRFLTTWVALASLIGLLGIVVGVWTWFYAYEIRRRGEFGNLTARSLRITDDYGKERVMIGVDDEGVAWMEFDDDRGRPAIMVRSEPDRGRSLAFYGPDGRDIVGLVVNPDGRVALNLSGKTNFSAVCPPDEDAYAVFYRNDESVIDAIPRGSVRDRRRSLP